MGGATARFGAAASVNYEGCDLRHFRIPRALPIEPNYGRLRLPDRCRSQRPEGYSVMPPSGPNGQTGSGGHRSEHSRPDWLAPGEEQRGLRRYVQTIRERGKLIALTVLVTTLAAALYVGTAQKTYKAEADLLVTPVPANDDNLNGSRADPRVQRPDPRRPDRRPPGHLDRRGPQGRQASSTRNRSARSLLQRHQGRPDRAEQPGRDHRQRAPRPSSAQNLANVFARRRWSRTARRSSTPSSTPRSRRCGRSVAALPTTRAGRARRPAPDPAERARDAARRATTRRSSSTRAPTSPPARPGPRRNLSIIAGIIAGPRARHRRRVRRADPRPAAAPRGPAARPLPAARAGPDPRGEPRAHRERDRSPPALARGRRGLPDPARDAHGAARRGDGRTQIGDDHRRLALGGQVDHRAEPGRLAWRWPASA